MIRVTASRIAAVLGQTKGPLGTSSHLTAVKCSSLRNTHTKAGLVNKTLSLLCKPSPQYLVTTQEFLHMERISWELCECRHGCATVCASLKWGARGSSLWETEPSHCRDPPCTDTHNGLPAANLILPRQRGPWVRLCVCGCSRCLLDLEPQSSSLACLRLLDPARYIFLYQIPQPSNYCLFTPEWLDWMDGGQEPKKEKKENTHLCINFPGASLVRTPFSIGLPSFADGLFTSERVKKSTWKWLGKETQAFHFNPNCQLQS